MPEGNVLPWYKQFDCHTYYQIHTGFLVKVLDKETSFTSFVIVGQKQDSHEIGLLQATRRGSIQEQYENAPQLEVRTQ